MPQANRISHYVIFVINDQAQLGDIHGTYPATTALRSRCVSTTYF
jgi:hypothetical protein